MEEIKVGTLKEDYLNGYVRNRFVSKVTNNPEQIGAFIMANCFDGDITITDSKDNALVTTFLMFINKCCDMEYLLKYLQPLMIDLQTGERHIEFIEPKIEKSV